VVISNKGSVDRLRKFERREPHSCGPRSRNIADFTEMKLYGERSSDGKGGKLVHGGHGECSCAKQTQLTECVISEIGDSKNGRLGCQREKDSFYFIYVPRLKF
jgi:hypothetical protein